MLGLRPGTCRVTCPSCSAQLKPHVASMIGHRLIQIWRQRKTNRRRRTKAFLALAAAAAAALSLVLALSGCGQRSHLSVTIAGRIERVPDGTIAEAGHVPPAAAGRRPGRCAGQGAARWVLPRLAAAQRPA